MIIEKGVDVDQLLSKSKDSNILLNVGIVVLGIAINFGIYWIFDFYKVTSEAPYLFSLFLCGALSVLAIHFVNRSKK